MRYADKMNYVKKSAIRSVMADASENGTVDYISFASGFPDPEAIPQEKLEEVGHKILQEKTYEVLQYGSAQGYTGLIESSKSFINKHECICTSNDDIIITTGSQQGLDLVSKIFCDEGDYVVVENPSYLGALNSFKCNGAKLLGVSLEEDGVNLEELEEALIMSDIGMDTSIKIISNLRERMKKEKIQDEEDVKQALREEMQKILDITDISLHLNTKPSVILVVGVNGVGKTTSIGKMANRLAKDGKKVVVAAADTFRAAAVEQLEIWSKRAGADIVKREEGVDPASVVFDAIKKTKENGADILIVDTAGRLHNKKYLMDELNKIQKVINKEMPDSDKEVLLVIDGTTGQNAISQVKAFKQETDITGIVLTKLDGTAKGGVVIGIVEENKIPVKFIGIGEQIDDMEIFNSEDFVKAII